MSKNKNKTFIKCIVAVFHCHFTSTEVAVLSSNSVSFILHYPQKTDVIAKTLSTESDLYLSHISNNLSRCSFSREAMSNNYIEDTGRKSVARSITLQSLFLSQLRLFASGLILCVFSLGCCESGGFLCNRLTEKTCLCVQWEVKLCSLTQSQLFRTFMAKIKCVKLR